jgi:ribosomal protein S10
MVALEKSYDIFKNLKSSKNTLKIDNKFFEIGNLKYVRLPKKRSIYTILKSPHIDKKARSQLGIISYNRLISLHLKDTVSSDNTKHFSNILESLKDVSIKTQYKTTNTI